MIAIESKNGLTNARVVGPVKNGDYLRQTVRRGDPAFVMSRSELKKFNPCPSKWIAGLEDEETDSTAWGSMLDCIILTPDEFSSRYIVAPATYPAKGKKKDDPEVQKPWSWNATYCKDWRDNQGEDVTVIKHGEADAITQAKSRLLKDASIAELLECSQFQVLATAEYHDPVTGIVVPLKCAVDILPDASHPKFGKSLADLKTCKSAHPYFWEKDVNNFWYDAQGSLYLDIFQAAGQDRCDFRHALSESVFPYQPGRRFLSAENLTVGRLKYQSALAKYCRCLVHDVWPDYELDAPNSRVRIDGDWLEVAPMNYALENI